MACHCKDCLCTRCGTRVDHDARQYLYSNLTSSGVYVCPDCYVRVWPTPVKLVFDQDCPEWVEPVFRTVEWVHRLREGFSSARGVVHFFNRRTAERTDWQALWDQRHHPVEPYSYRGWCAGWKHEIVILVDEVETPESVQWIVLHELGHLACTQAPFIDKAMDRENANDGRTHYEWKDDRGHEADSEERLVNRVATAYMGGKEYARPWWRARVTAKLAGLPREQWPDNPTPHRYEAPE
jgi:hypothetical protein